MATLISQRQYCSPIPTGMTAAGYWHHSFKIEVQFQLGWKSGILCISVPKCNLIQTGMVSHLLGIRNPYPCNAPLHCIPKAPDGGKGGIGDNNDCVSNISLNPGNKKVHLISQDNTSSYPNQHKQKLYTAQWNHYWHNVLQILEIRTSQWSQHYASN